MCVVGCGVIQGGTEHYLAPELLKQWHPALVIPAPPPRSPITAADDISGSSSGGGVSIAVDAALAAAVHRDFTVDTRTSDMW